MISKILFTTVFLFAMKIALAGSADLVVIGPIRTMNPEKPTASAMAVEAGKIVYVGEAKSARERLATDGKVIELGPKQIVLPGFIDSHIHPFMAGLKAQGLVIDYPESKEALLASIAAYAKAHPDQAWIVGHGLTPTFEPTLAELDAVTDGRPAILHGQDAHSALVNSRALKIAGIDKSTPNPELGLIDRDKKTGEAVGSLRETAVYLVEKHVPKPTPEILEAALQYSQSHLHSLGVTSILDANVKPEMLEAYERAQAAGILTLKVAAALSTDPSKTNDQVDEMVKERKQFSNGRITIGTAKIFVDGVLEGKTAALLEPYEGTDDRGFLNWDPKELTDLVTRLDKEGFQVYMHAIGDRAVREGLNAVEAARSVNGLSDNRHQITHVEMVDPTDIPRFAKLDVITNFQPFWWSGCKGKDDHRVPLVGNERAERFYPVRKILSHGAKIVAGSDWPITEANPFPGIEAALDYPENQAPSTDVTGAKLDLEKLLAAYTIGGAFASHREKEIGSIEAGKAADFIILDRDLFAVSPEEIGETQVLATYIDGKPVFKAGKK